MEQGGREHWANLGRLVEEIAQSGENVVIGADGTVSAGEPVDGCVVSYTNCHTFKDEIQILKKGETFAYGDWIGDVCIRKTFTC